MRQFTVEKVKNFLEKHYGKQLASTPWSDCEDGEIEITETIGVQVGLNYLAVGYWDEAEQGVYVSPRVYTYKEVISLVEEMMVKFEAK